MKIDDLMEMKVKDLLEEFCLVYSPECGHNYGITRWSDANTIYEEFDLEDEYCFCSDSLIPIDYGFDEGEDVIDINGLKHLMNVLGIPKKEKCPNCNSKNYHLNYNNLQMLCNDCGHVGKPEYEKINEEEE